MIIYLDRCKTVLNRIKSILSFTLVGVLAAGVDFGSLWLLLQLGLIPPISRAGSYVAGSTFAYYLNSYVTFSGNRSSAEKGRAIVSYLICWSLAVGVNSLFRWGFGSMDDLVFWAWFVSQGCATCVNYLLQSFWVFRKPK